MCTPSLDFMWFVLAKVKCTETTVARQGQTYTVRAHMYAFHLICHNWDRHYHRSPTISGGGWRRGAPAVASWSPATQVTRRAAMGTASYPMEAEVSSTPANLQGHRLKLFETTECWGGRLLCGVQPYWKSYLRKHLLNKKCCYKSGRKGRKPKICGIYCGTEFQVRKLI